MSSDSDGGCLGLILMLALIVFVIYLIIMAIYYIAMISAAIGGVYGGVIATTNYVKAFKQNVKREKYYHA